MPSRVRVGERRQIPVARNHRETARPVDDGLPNRRVFGQHAVEPSLVVDV
jgi:hypothetical protein